MRFVSFAVLGLLVGTTFASGPEEQEKLHFFESKIRPLLIEHCYDCHSEESGESEGNLLLDSAAGVLKGGSFGPSLIPGKPNQSLIVLAVRYDNAKLQMPPAEKLDEESIQLLERWVAMGAPDPRISKSVGEETEEHSFDPQSHWAFQLPKRIATSKSVHPTDRDVIDSAARDSADRAGIPVAKSCGDETLIRRLYHDLTGLSPSLEQIESFAESKRINKTERLVDQLLASPEFAERFARHWMDIARYADTVGYALGGKERRLIGSERYRDWLIRAFADDLPYDQMIRYQLAADRHDPENEGGHLDAMGFLTIGRRYLNRFDTIDDRIDVITRGLLGMTVTCARCHDHKFDPIPTTDYYSMVGVLESSETKQDGPSPLMLIDKPKPRDSHVFLRGQVGARGEIAPRQYFTALRKPDEPKFSDGSGRVELADRIASPDNPLVARVMVNRVWRHLIGRPFVDSMSDFGVRTDSPELVELFDELAADFASHWSVKRLIRRIVTSRIYAQSTVFVGQSDPENRLASRGNRKRKDFESMRDTMLQVCGTLDRSMGGESVDIHLATPVSRRTLYARIDRQNLPSLFRTFDFASPDAHTPKRLTTTVPQQALFLLNHPQMGTLASDLANRIESRGQSSSEQAQAVFEVVLGRRPSEAERAQAMAFLETPARPPKSRFEPRRAWQFGTTPNNKEMRVTEFRPFPHFTGSSWQREEKLPSGDEFDWATLSAKNGHPGSKHAVVRRWTAPADGKLSLSGQVGHTNPNGDGIELAIWIGDRRIWKIRQKSANRPFSGLKGEIKAGQTVDIVASCGDSINHDTFFLMCKLRLDSGDQLFEADSMKDFSGPLPEKRGGLDRLTQLVQTLLLSNEFLFVD